MTVQIVRMLCLLTLTGLAAAVPSGCTSRESPSPATPATQDGQAVCPTVQEAAVGAWDFREPGFEDSIPVPNSGSVDRAATIRLWRSRPELLKKTMVDLNGDGADDVLLCNAYYVDMNGKEQHVWAGVGQWCLWAVIEKIPDGWRVVGCGWGSCPPDVQEQVTHGWKNLTSNYHLSAGHGVMQLYQFDGTRYRLTKNTDWGSPPNSSDDDSHE